MVVRVMIKMFRQKKVAIVTTKMLMVVKYQLQCGAALKWCLNRECGNVLNTVK
jgi:hypothetical protein